MLLLLLLLLLIVPGSTSNGQSGATAGIKTTSDDTLTSQLYHLPSICGRTRNWYLPPPCEWNEREEGEEGGRGCEREEGVTGKKV